MATVQTPIAKSDRTIPPMSYPRRIRAAARLAWRTMTTGQDLMVESYFNGTRDGMDTIQAAMSRRLAERTAAWTQGGNK